ncbi:unnamed protein product [Acanthoscelides obtectus]|uniref:Serpin domain-containing protein n=1 Tax=Acanthoscelides obtectus TaxID=200917 RepID=A0A9P0LY74_ACAOB|nr:unnamed protein product [Acanthoscelides obtectus]CAK1626504.1 Serpin A3-7 [Acanthoscelides obtectus]
MDCHPLVLLLITLLHISPLLSQSNPLIQRLNPDKEQYQRYTQALEAIFGMGIRLQVLLDKHDSPNFVVSPLSTVVVIGQLMLGAEGEFQDQLYDLLSLPKPKVVPQMIYQYGKGGNTSSSLRYAEFHLQLSGLVKALQKRRGDELFILDQDNALFYSVDIHLKDQFQRYMEKFYETEIKSLDFRQDTKSIINHWASSHTNGIINNILSTSPPPSTTSILLNSIYFKAEWDQPFSDQFNRVDKFYVSENRTVDTTYMLGTLEQIPFVEMNDFRLLSLPYKDKELGMYILYPTQNHEHKYNMKKFVQKLRPELLYQALLGLRGHDVIVKIPKLSLSNTLSILEPLQEYAQFKKEQQAKATKARISFRFNSPRLDDGAEIIKEIQNELNKAKNFTVPRSYKDIILTGAADESKLRVSNIVQQMVFSINEKGTEAAAVTAGVTDYIGGQKVVVLNRPFCFFIRHEATSATIFWGTISDPSKS